MAKIIGSNKDVTEETLFLGTEIPKYGVVTNHEMELEKAINFNFCLYFINIIFFARKAHNSLH